MPVASAFVCLPAFCNRRSGFNLVESAIVLGVIGLVIGGIWTAASAMQSSFRQGNIASAILQTNQRIKQAYPRGVAETGITNPWQGVEFLVFDSTSLATKTSIPEPMRSTMVGTGPQVYKDAGGAFYLSAFHGGTTFVENGTTYDRINYEITGINATDCRWLIDWIYRNAITKLSSPLYSSQGIYIQVGNVNGGTQQASGTPASVALANHQALCTSNGLNIVRLRMPWPY